MAETWRLLGPDAATGDYSLALHEALLLSQAAGEAPPTLRLYTWAACCVTIGCGQPIADIDLEYCTAAGLPVLRRLSGGTAVLHEPAQLAFMMVLPPAHPLVHGDVVESYAPVSRALLRALSYLGIQAEALPPAAARALPADPLGRAACFGALAPYEIVWQGKKLIGHAQVRRRSAVLLGGTLLLAFDPAALARVLRVAQPGERARLQAYLAQRVASAREAAGRPVGFDEAFAAFSRAWQEEFGVRLEPGRLSAAEERWTAELREGKYRLASWNERR
jgi:lipoate-protein ligase A